MIRVLFFGALTDVAGRDCLDLDWQASLACPDALRQRLGAGDSALGRALNQPQVLVARNRELVDWQSPLTDGDEIAFMPPVTGG